jgi:hypothetical protein
MNNCFLKLSYILNIFIIQTITELKTGNNFRRSFWKSKFLTYAEWSWALPLSLLQALPFYCCVFCITPPQRIPRVASIYGSTTCTWHTHSAMERSCWRCTVHTEWRILYLKQNTINHHDHTLGYVGGGVHKKTQLVNLTPTNRKKD